MAAGTESATTRGTATKGISESKLIVLHKIRIYTHESRDLATVHTISPDLIIFTVTGGSLALVFYFSFNTVFVLCPRTTYLTPTRRPTHSSPRLRARRVLLCDSRIM
jgi:hypothetical protein